MSLSRPNILIMAYWHDPRFKKKAGGLIRMFELADNLLALGHRVTMVLPRLGFPKTQTRADVVEIPFVDLPVLRPLSFHILSSVCLAYLCLKRFDRIYIRQMNSFLPFLIARLFGIYSYFELPNDPYLGYAFEGRSKARIVGGIDALCTKLCDRIVVLSGWSKARVSRIGGVALSKILVFPSGTDTNLFHPLDKAAARREVGLDPSSPVVGFIGSFLAFQGIDILIDAAPRILERAADARFLLVGDGPMKKPWEERVERAGLAHHFIFTGHVPYRQVPLYLGAMDVCVAPHYADTNQASPVKLFDYMAAGRPIVASDIDVVREITADSGSAILTAPEDPVALAEGIIDLLIHPDRRDEMARRARTYAVERYDRLKLTKELFANI